MMAEYTMEDTQNSAPGEPTAHEASKLTAAPRRPDAQSVTKRYCYSRCNSSCGCMHESETILADAYLQPANRTHDLNDAPNPVDISFSIITGKSPPLDRHCYRPCRDTLCWPNFQTLLRVPSQLPLCSASRALQDTNLPPECRFFGQNLSRHPER